MPPTVAVVVGALTVAAVLLAIGAADAASCSAARAEMLLDALQPDVWPAWPLTCLALRIEGIPPPEPRTLVAAGHRQRARYARHLPPTPAPPSGIRVLFSSEITSYTHDMFLFV